MAEMKPSAGPHPAASQYDKSIGQALGVQAFGIYHVELPPGAETVSHDHIHDQAEDVYGVISGDGVIVVDGEEVPIAQGQYIAVSPESVRHARAGNTGLCFIAVCAVRSAGA